MAMKRIDGRKPEELRQLVVKAGVLERAQGSALVKLGRTTALAAVYGPKRLFSKHQQIPNKGLLEAHYVMLPFSTDDRIRPGTSRRSTEISKVMRLALEPVLFLEEFPRAGIEIHVAILQAEAGTRTAAINAASVALADAGIPMKDLVVSVSAGKIDGEYVLDLVGKEEEMTECDLPIAYIPREKKISLLQMDGDMPLKDVKGVMNLAIKGCEIIYEKQKQALKERWIDQVKTTIV
ncbi:MAG TPA: exosome complex exonuclease Rrp41 [archaeon]|nr:exosome complex exonuclease Rrp41 [archaeon]